VVHLIHRFSELIEDWQTLIRQDGPKSALPLVAREIAQLPYRHLHFIILARTLAEPLPAMQPKIPLEIRPFGASHLELVRAIDRPSEARLCERRLRNGQRGLVAFHRSQLAGYAWGCCPVNWELERVTLKLEPGDILCSDVFTTPALRRMGVQTALTLKRFELFRDLGLSRAICYIEFRNAPSLAVWQRKLGSKIVGRIDFLRIGPWYQVRYSYSPTCQERGDLVELPVAQSNTRLEDMR